MVISSHKRAVMNPVPQQRAHKENSLSSRELQELQENDPTLSRVREKADELNKLEGEFLRERDYFTKGGNPRWVICMARKLFTRHIHNFGPKVDATKVAMWCTGPIHRLPLHSMVIMQLTRQ